MHHRLPQRLFNNLCCSLHNAMRRRRHPHRGPPNRFAGMPAVPTIAESGVAGYDMAGWNGIALPAKTPRAIVERLNREMLAALAQPDIREKFEEFGIDAHGGTPENLRDLLASEIAKWKQVVESTGIEKQ